MTQTLSAESVRQRGFYVPQFELKVQNSGIPDEVVRDITQVTYHDNIKEIDGFELTVNNWNVNTRNFKYVGAETAESANNPYFTLFEPCSKKVELSMGYLGDLRLMLTGRFTTMEPTFPSGGAPTLTVRGVNVLNELRTKQYTYSWTNIKDSDLAQNLATLTDAGQKRFKANIQVAPNATDNEPQIEYVAEENQYDIDFLLSRARQRGYVIYLTENPNGSTPTIYFGPSTSRQSTGGREVTFQLDWGRSLVDFKPTMTTVNQVKSVTVHGWDRRAKRAITERVSLEDREIHINRDIQRLITQCNPREEIVVNEPVFTRQQAHARAAAILLGRQQDFVKASGTTVGLPDLRAGVNVQIGGIGSRFSGNYFVTETTHTIGTGGYTTKFTARREEPGQAARV